MKKVAFFVLLIFIIGFMLTIATTDAETVPKQEQNDNAGEIIVPVFGKGKIDIWFYSNFFCEWCKLGSDFDRMISELVHNDVITITFVDILLTHVKYSPSAAKLYARYFFYALKYSKDFNQAMRVRKALYEAAWAAIKDESKLEAYLNQQGITVTKFDATPSLKNLNKYINYLTGDGKGKWAIPACAVMSGSERKLYIGSQLVNRAFSTILEGTKRSD